MKYTLIAFEYHPDAIDKAAWNLVFQHPAALAEVANGVYVFDTQKGWIDIHLLKSLLTRLKIPFVELPFEQGLSGFFPPSIRDKLKAIGIKDDALLNLSD